MGNKTVIIAVVNRAYVEQDVESDSTMLDIFLSSFWLGEGTRSLIHHILLVAVDQIAYDRCMFLKMNCFRLETDGVDFKGEKIYMSQDFIKMMWRRTQFLLEVLKHGYNFIFTVSNSILSLFFFYLFYHHQLPFLMFKNNSFFNMSFNLYVYISCTFIFNK